MSNLNFTGKQGTFLQRRDCQDRIRTDIPPFSHGDLVIFKEFFESLLLTKRPAVSGIRTRDPLHGSQVL